MSRDRGYLRWRWQTRHLDPEQTMVAMLERYGRKAFRVLSTPESPIRWLRRSATPAEPRPGIRFARHAGDPGAHITWQDTSRAFPFSAPIDQADKKDADAPVVRKEPEA